MFGLAIPALDSVAFAGVGLIVPPLVSSWILSAIPATWKTNTDGTPNQITNFVVKAASVIGPSMIVRQFVSRKAGNIMLVAGGAWFVIEAIKIFAPTVATKLGLQGIGFQPMLGAYLGPQRPARLGNGRGNVYSQMPAITANTPSRLNPAERF